MCAKAELDRIEGQMEQAYRQLIGMNAAEPNIQTAIKTAHMAWFTYRDAFLEAMWPGPNKDQQCGSSYPLLYGDARIKLTRQQIVALKDLIAEYTPR